MPYEEIEERCKLFAQYVDFLLGEIKKNNKIKKHHTRVFHQKLVFVKMYLASECLMIKRYHYSALLPRKHILCHDIIALITEYTFMPLDIAQFRNRIITDYKELELIMKEDKSLCRFELPTYGNLIAMKSLMIIIHKNISYHFIKQENDLIASVMMYITISMDKFDNTIAFMSYSNEYPHIKDI